MSNHWKVRINSSAKGDLKRILKIPFWKVFEEKNILETGLYKPIRSFVKLPSLAMAYYSRRINGQFRVVYTISTDIIAS